MPSLASVDRGCKAPHQEFPDALCIISYLLSDFHKINILIKNGVIPVFLHI